MTTSSMMHGVVSLLIGLTVMVPPSNAPKEVDQKEVKDDQPQTYALRMVDQSTLHIKTNETIELETPYGDLKIPLDKTMRVVFAHRVSPEDENNINKCQKNLGSDIYAQREAASRQLIEMARKSYPFVLKLTKSKDAETARRVEHILRVIETKYAKESLWTQDYDQVLMLDTANAYKGKIKNKGFKCESCCLGELKVNIWDMRTLENNKGIRKEIKIDVRNQGLNVDESSWTATDLYLYPGDHIEIRTEGQIDIWPQTPGQYLCDADGHGSAQGKTPLSAFKAGSLVAKIGNASPFGVGKDYQGTITTAQGQLYLIVAPSPWNNAMQGVYNIKISLSRYTGISQTPPSPPSSSD